MTKNLLANSHLLHQALLSVLDDVAPCPGERFSVSMAACGIAFDHASGVRNLAEAGLATSAAALLRVQFEALIRAMWLLYAATDAEIQMMSAPLSAETQKAANKLPMTKVMLDALKMTAPAAAIQPLLQFKELSAGPMNSFVHSGVHSLHRHQQGFPVLLLDQIIRSSNAMNTMCCMLAAILTGDSNSVVHVKVIQRQFLDVLPPLAQEH